METGSPGALKIVLLSASGYTVVRSPDTLDGGGLANRVSFGRWRSTLLGAIMDLMEIDPRTPALVRVAPGEWLVVYANPKSA